MFMQECKFVNINNILPILLERLVEMLFTVVVVVVVVVVAVCSNKPTMRFFNNNKIDIWIKSVESNTCFISPTVVLSALV